MGRVKNVPMNSTVFGAPSGESTANMNRGPVQMIAPVTPLTLRNLKVSTGSSLGTGEDVTLTVVVGSTTSALTCDVNGATCQDTQHTATVPAGTTPSVQVTSTARIRDVYFGFSVQG